ncbi:UvrD-helicase domain-containing protein [Aquabacterium sp.]|uniref:UvrD-helicase domain-containing protein n=1 Tax=Aquabacterium sp. TaxID=1872578 RepID=UPI00378523FA
MSTDTAAFHADGAPCTREAFYAIACDPARSVVVQACAGAGKTWMLVSRMLRALLDGVRPQEILAITFTRKAAGEMRERLNGWLAEYALATAADRVQALRDRGMGAADAERLQPVLAGLQARVLASGRAVDIQTFHAWFSQLMRAAPHELLDRLGLQPGMDLLEDTSELQPELMRRFHAAVAADAAALADYTALLQGHGRNRLAAWLATSRDKRIEIELADDAGRIDSSVPPAMPDGRDPMLRMRDDPALRAQLEAAARRLGPGASKQRDAAEGLRAALEQTDTVLAFDSAWQALFTKKGDPRKLGDHLEIQAAVEALQTLQAQRNQQRAHDDHLAMLRLSRLLLREWRALKRLRAVADMPDLERCALALLSDPVLSGWVQQRLDTRIRQVLIDEFQDTSPLQWHALSAWLSSYAGAGGGASGQRPPSVFIVGDPKQSIYRFRRAEPRVFDAAREFVRTGLEGSVLECDHTRRNAPGVIAVLNQVFGAAEMAGEFAGYRPHSTEVTEGPSPALQALPEAERAARAKAAAPEAPRWRDSLTERRTEPEQLFRRAEAAQVAAAVVELLARGQAPGEIMVLSRKRAGLALVAEELRLRQAPCMAGEELRLADLPEASDLIALLDALASPAHDLALAQALKSPLFDASDAELLALAQRARAIGLPWQRALARWSEAPPSLARARDLLAGWRALLPVLPPHDLLDRIVHEGDVPARLVAAARPERRGLALQAVRALLAQSLALDGGRYATAYNFVRALRQRALRVSAPAQADAVQLLTVHGAKGLEAEVVFVLDADAEPPRAGQAGLMIDWPLHERAPARVAFVASDSRVPPSLQPLDAAEAMLQAREDLNLLYVAMTRARQRLVVSRTPARSPSPRAWWPRLAPLASPWSPDLARQAVEGSTLPKVPELPPAPPGPTASTAPEAPADPTVDEAAARRGQAVHRVLEWAAQGDLRRADVSALARSAAQAFEVPDDQVAAVAQAAAEVLGAPQLAPFFDAAAVRWAGNEVPVAVAGRSLRIDRLVQLKADGCWWVLDYKLNTAPERLAENREQLRQYRAAVRALQPGETVRAAFIAGGGRLVELD